MKYNYFLGTILALIFPGFIQYYTKEYSKANQYILLYFTSFMLVFIILTINGHIINVSNIDEIAKNENLIKISLIINILFRLMSGIDGLIQIRKYNVYYGK